MMCTCVAAALCMQAVDRMYRMAVPACQAAAALPLREEPPTGLWASGPVVLVRLLLSFSCLYYGTVYCCIVTETISYSMGMICWLQCKREICRPLLWNAFFWPCVWEDSAKAFTYVGCT